MFELRSFVCIFVAEINYFTNQKQKDMKKVLWLMALVLPLLFAGCSSDSDRHDEQQSSIVGIWQETSPNENSFISLAQDGTFKLFASRNNKVGFMLDAGYYSQEGNTLKFQSVNGKNYDYTFTSNNDGSLSIPIDGNVYTFKTTGIENNAHTNPLIGRTFNCSEGGYMWVGGTDYGTIEFTNGYILKYTITTVKSKVTQKVTNETYNYLFMNDKLYIQQRLGYYICTYKLKNDVITITDADGRQVFK